MNSWFDTDDVRGLAPTTWKKYAYSLLVWLSFLWAYGQPWDDVELTAEEAFRTWRTLDESNPRPVESGTYGDDLTVIRLFYLWAASAYQVPNPIRTRSTRGKRRDGTQAEKRVTAPKATRDRDVKWFDTAGFERYRDCGLLGLTLEGDEDLGWRGRNGQRNAAFADLLYGTALRLEEGGSLLLVELPPDDPSRGFYTCHMAEKCAKGDGARRYWMSRKALLPVLGYCEGARATAVRRARAAGRYEQIAGARLLTRMLPDRRVRLVTQDGLVSEVPLDSVTPLERRRLLRETPQGLEPVALWLNEDGLPRDPNGWEPVFTEANKRLRGLGQVRAPWTEARSKMHVLSDANGLPLIVGLSAADVHDSRALKPMVLGHQTRHDPHRGRYFKPQRLHADKAYDVPHLRRWLRGKRIARKGIESSERLGRRRWVIERTLFWLTGYCRLNHRYEGQPRNYLAFLGLAATLCCYKRLLRLTT